MKRFYITTPIYYVNDRLHIGHAYTTIMADIIARWHRLEGDDVFFLTGSDEHGEKIAKAAKLAGKEPGEFADSIVKQFLDLWKKLKISNDDFIRTTEPRHEEVVLEFVRRMIKSGDVYRGVYEGWYCTPDETFFTELQLKDGRCPVCGREVKKVKEDSYFFRLSKYQERLLSLYKENPGFLSPEFRSREILNRVREGLNDISITRTTIRWAIQFPEDEEHYVYVWVDALLNYISALGWPKGERFKRFWPANIHIVGKEINWFHSVIWPAMLMSVGMETPGMVFAHGWWTVEGRKMSKSLGNAINPVEMVRKYGLDAFRYFLVRQMPFGEDGDFSEKELVSRINGELVNDLGNLVYRVLTLAERFEGRIEGRPELDKELRMEEIKKRMDDLDLFGALDGIWHFIRASNKYINEREVWKLSGTELSSALYNLLESIRIISILISPFMPDASDNINAQIGVTKGTLKDAVFRRFEGTTKKGRVLFNKIGSTI